MRLRRAVLHERAGPPQALMFPLGGTGRRPQGAPVTTAPTHLLYLHGFRSSPQSFKALLLQRWMQQHRPDVHWWCPQLPPSPSEAIALLTQGIAAWPLERTAVLGSSLGGFYATVLAERTGCPAVLINPAVHPERDLARCIGDQTMFHAPQEHFFFRPEFIDQLRALNPSAVTDPRRYFVLIAKGDEVLDWREMADRYAGTRGKLLAGGDHALSDFEQHLPDLIAFLSLQLSSTEP
jgi:uncharacterized protein